MLNLIPSDFCTIEHTKEPCHNNSQYFLQNVDQFQFTLGIIRRPR